MPVGNSEPGGNGVNPLCRAFDFSEVADRCFVNDHMTGGVAPLAAELLIGEAGLEAASSKDVGQRLPVFDRCLDFAARFVPARSRDTLLLVGHRPLRSVLADAQQSAPAPERATGKI